MKIRKTLWVMSQEERKEAIDKMNFYSQKLFKMMTDGKGIPTEQGEQFAICKPPYPPYWVITNYAKVWSIYGNEPKQLHPFQNSGKRNPIGRERLHHGKEKFALHRIVADHFCVNYARSANYHVHHIKPINQFTAEEIEANIPHRADNLQIVEPEEQHHHLTKIQKMPTIPKDQEDKFVAEDLQHLEQLYGKPMVMDKQSIKDCLKDFIANGGVPIVSQTDDNGSAWLQPKKDFDIDNLDIYAVVIRPIY